MISQEMRPVFIVILIAFLVPRYMYSQDTIPGKDQKKRTVALGGTMIQLFLPGDASLNYDQLFYIRKFIRLGGHLGFGYARGIYLNIPASFNIILGKKAGSFEAGAGACNFLAADEPNGKLSEYLTSFTIHAGYRYQKPLGGFFYKATVKRHRFYSVTNPLTSQQKLMFAEMFFGYSF